MAKYKKQPRKRRSPKQKAQISSLAALRMQRRAFTNGHNPTNEHKPGPGSAAVLQEKERQLKQVQRMLKCTKQREDRARLKVTRLNTKLREVLADSRRQETLLQAKFGKFAACK